MTHQKQTLTKAEKEAIEARNKRADRRARKMAEEAAKNVVPPPLPKQRPRRIDPAAGKKSEKSVEGKGTL